MKSRNRELNDIIDCHIKYLERSNYLPTDDEYATRILKLQQDVWSGNNNKSFLGTNCMVRIIFLSFPWKTYDGCLGCDPFTTPHTAIATL